MAEAGTLAVNAFVRSGLFDVLKNALDNARYSVLAMIRTKVYMDEARHDAINGLEESLKSEVKVWAGLGWEADKCPAVCLAKGKITNQSDIEALAACSVSIYDQAILDVGGEELCGRKGFSHIVMSKLEESSLLIDSEVAANWLRSNAKATMKWLIHRKEWRNRSVSRGYYTIDVDYIALEDLVTNEVAEVVLQDVKDRPRMTKDSVKTISIEDGKWKQNEQEDHDHEYDMFLAEVHSKHVQVLKELEFESKMDKLQDSFLLIPSPISEKRGHNQGNLQPPRPLITAIGEAARHNGINITNEGLGRIVQSELALNAGRPAGPVRLCMAKEIGAWEFNGLLTASDVKVLNDKSDEFTSAAAGKWSAASEKESFSELCAIAACLSSSFLLTYEDRTNSQNFSRRHLVLDGSGRTQALMITTISGNRVITRMECMSQKNLAETDEEVLNDFLGYDEDDSISDKEMSIRYSMFRSWHTIMKATFEGSFSPFEVVAKFLDKSRRRQFIAFLRRIASGKFHRFQREECRQEHYLDVEEGKRTTGCKWLDDLIRGWAVSKTSTRIRVALSLKREEIASALGVTIRAKVPETNLEVLNSRMRDIKKLVTRLIRRGTFLDTFLGERGSIVALANSFKDREFSARNRFRRCMNDRFVVHVSGKNVIVVEKKGQSRIATWLPCEQEGIEATYTANRVGELSDKAALALLVFGRCLDLMDNVLYYQMTQAENGDLSLERSLTQVVKLAATRYNSSTELAREVVSIASKEVALSLNDEDMIKRYIMVTAYAEGVGKITTSGRWKALVPEVKAARGGTTFKIDYKMPTVMLHGDGEWVVVNRRAYKTSKRNENERIVRKRGVKEAGYLSESFWPGGLVLD